MVDPDSTQNEQDTDQFKNFYPKPKIWFKARYNQEHLFQAAFEPRLPHQWTIYSLYLNNVNIYFPSQNVPKGPSVLSND